MRYTAQKKFQILLEKDYYTCVDGDMNTEYRNDVRLLAYNKYDALTKVSTRKHFSEYAHLLK